MSSARALRVQTLHSTHKATPPASRRGTALPVASTLPLKPNLPADTGIAQNNIVTAQELAQGRQATSRACTTAGPSSRVELERAARAAVEADNGWWQLNVAACPPNLRHADSPKAFKTAILTAADAGQLVIVDYFKPSCHACRTVAPKLKQLAEQNSDVVVLQVNTDEAGMQDLAAAMGVEVLPWFQLWRNAEPVAAFTANISTLFRLRAEVAVHLGMQRIAATGGSSQLQPALIANAVH